jgi:hypothetical protein
LSEYFTLKIYIHTWNKKANNISWREYKENNEIVTKKLIQNYFKDLKICSIIIDDDQQINLIGDTNGNMFSTTMPKIGWKNMWYGLYKSIVDIYENENDKTIILNIRFDIFTNSNKITQTAIFKWVNELLQKSKYKKFNKNIFFRETPNLSGVDNQILGDKNTLYKLISHFNNNLDDINKLYLDLHCHEESVYYENLTLYYA